MELGTRLQQNYDLGKFSWEMQITFYSLSYTAKNKLISTTLFVSVIRNLRIEFSSRFSEIRFCENNIGLFGTPLT